MRRRRVRISVAIGVEPGSTTCQPALRQGLYPRRCRFDGAHIAALCCRCSSPFPPLVEGHVYVAKPPLYRTSPRTSTTPSTRPNATVFSTHQAAKGQVTVTRFKGLGEMNPAVARERVRRGRLAQLTIAPGDKTFKIMDMMLARNGRRMQGLAADENGRGRRQPGTELRRRRTGAAARLHREGIPRLLDVRILDRALPHIGDGLKPVQRRICTRCPSSTCRPLKAQIARTVGDVLGKYLHGDSACYEAMVLMAQPFSYRYPDRRPGGISVPRRSQSFAACVHRVAPVGFCRDSAGAGAGYGRLGANFDGTMQEPSLLPARLRTCC